MKKGKLLLNLKLALLMTPFCGFAIAPIHSSGDIITSITVEDENFDEGINSLNINEAIIVYAQNQMKLEEKSINGTMKSGLTPYETDTNSITQDKIVEQKEKYEKEQYELLKRIMETSDAANEINSLTEEKVDEELIVETGTESDKDVILNTFKKCKTLNDIDNRRKELESLNLTDDDKIYKNCKASAEMQHFIYEQSIIYGYPFDFALSIISTETRDEFNGHGKEAYNKGCNNYDLGYSQQNSQWSLPVFKEKFKIESTKEAYNILLNNDYANVCAAFLEFNEIDKCHKSFDPYEYAGCYNGWLNWKQKSTSREYVYDYFMSKYDNKYNEYHTIEKSKNIQKKGNTKKK